MDATRHLPRLTNVAPPSINSIRLVWHNAGLRTRILIPLVLLMSLSVLVSIASFVLSTNATRNRLLDGQLNEDMARISAALAQREQVLTESAALLAGDNQFVQAIAEDNVRPGTSALLSLDRRALVIRDRYRLDQVLVLNAQGQTRVNITAQSSLSHMSAATRDQILGLTKSGQTALVAVEQTWLLVSYAPIYGASSTGQGAPAGAVYTLLDLRQELRRIRRELELTADVSIATANAQIATTMPLLAAALPEGQPQLSLGDLAYRVQSKQIALGNVGVQLAVLRNEAAIDAIVSSGLQAMLISSGITLLLLIATGVLLARSLIKPILHLSQVAQGVAAGDLSRKAHMRQFDEIGQLGRAFDRATDTISGLLEQQSQAVSERQAILNSIADGVLAINLEQRIMLINPTAASLFGYAEATLYNQPLAMLSRVQDPTISVGVYTIVEFLRATLTNKPGTPTEQQVALGSRVVRLGCAPIVSGGTYQGAVVVLQDITAAVDADRAKNEFIAVASHELRTPLTGLKGFVDLFDMDGTANLSSIQRECFDVIRRQTSNLVLLVNDLLEMARIEQGSLRADRRWIAPVTAIEDSLAPLQVQISRKSLQLQIETDADLPLLWIDGLHLNRILSNLLTNATKYTPNGGKITLRAYEIDDPTLLPSAPGEQPWRHHSERSLVFSVSDNGVGILPEDQPKIFSRFFRSDNTLSIAAGGTGLGLTITQALVCIHDGQIGFYSNTGQGSCFWVRLPIKTTTAIEQLPAL